MGSERELFEKPYEHVVSEDQDVRQPSRQPNVNQHTSGQTSSEPPKAVGIVKGYTTPNDRSTVVCSKSPTSPTQLFVPWRANPLCWLCQSTTKPHQIGEAITHRTYLDLKISAARGCPLCQFLYRAVGTQPNEKAISKPLLVTPYTHTITVVDYTSTSIDFEIFADIRTPLNSLSEMGFRQTAAHSESDEFWELINSWIHDCGSNHANCVREEAHRTFPTRVLDISGDSLRLVQSKDVDSQREPFVTLSHCWGSSTAMPITTTQRSELYLRGIDIATLPKTFRDAINTTRRLQIRYIWIDALCIMQDSKVDWEQEAARMGQYYKDAFLTLSALDARSGEIGFLRQRPLQSTAQIGKSLHIRPSRSPWRDVFQQSPLSQRAWVLQERLLSTRVLHFGDDELFWECSTFSARESSNKLYTLEGQSTQWADENFKRSLHFATRKTEEIMNSWYTVICQYSGLQLSFFTDVFPAISGIARAFHGATNYQYVAGLWLEHISSGLLWYRHHLDKTDTHVSNTHNHYTAPSWSWASLHGPIKMIYGKTSHETDNTLKAVILAASASLTTPDQFSVISDAYLQLEAYCIDVWYKGSHGHPPYNDPYLALVLDIYDSNGIMIGTGYLDYLGDSIDGTLKHALAVVISQRVDSTLSSDPVTYFLLVEPNENSEDKKYRRVGIGQTADLYHGNVIDRPITEDLFKRMKISLL